MVARPEDDRMKAARVAKVIRRPAGEPYLDLGVSLHMATVQASRKRRSVVRDDEIAGPQDCDESFAVHLAHPTGGIDR
jgi:hypothetical protein